MTIDHPLPPRLEQFVRDQLASGRFHSEGEVIRAALSLLEEQSPPHQAPGPSPKQDPGNARGGHPLEPAGEGLRADTGGGNDTPMAAAGRRSPRGILADVPSGISLDDIMEARGEMWSGISHGQA